VKNSEYIGRQDRGHGAEDMERSLQSMQIINGNQPEMCDQVAGTKEIALSMKCWRG
jgi:hypothetical protein